MLNVIEFLTAWQNTYTVSLTREKHTYTYRYFQTESIWHAFVRALAEQRIIGTGYDNEYNGERR